jgi:hypothetical protein
VPTLLAVGAVAAILGVAIALNLYRCHKLLTPPARPAARALTDRQLMLAYHAKRAREIRAALDAMGDDAQHLFPPSRN